MHRLILNPPAGITIDHINGNGLDNRRENLRLAGRGQNQCNRGKQSNNTSGFKGVTWHKNLNKWEAGISISGKRYHVGFYKTPEAAARAYDDAAKKYHGEFARLNFPK